MVVGLLAKVWIVPEKAVVYENGGAAFVLENHLKVMLEQDYLAIEKTCRRKALAVSHASQSSRLMGNRETPTTPIKSTP